MLRVRGYLTVEEAAALIGCTRHWIYILLSRKLLVGEKISERRIMVKESSAKKYAGKPKILGRPRISTVA